MSALCRKLTPSRKMFTQSVTDYCQDAIFQFNRAYCKRTPVPESHQGRDTNRDGVKLPTCVFVLLQLL